MRLRIAFLAGLALALTPALGLAQSAYQNPIDGRSYGPFETAIPTNPVETAGKTVFTNRIILLTPDAELRQRITLPELTKFIKFAQGAAYDALKTAKSPAEVLVQFNCAANKCSVKIANRGDVDRAILQALYDALSKPVPMATKDEVVFQIDFIIRV
jgi:hypothetical protein